MLLLVELIDPGGKVGELLLGGPAFVLKALPVPASVPQEEGSPGQQCQKEEDRTRRQCARTGVGIVLRRHRLAPDLLCPRHEPRGEVPPLEILHHGIVNGLLGGAVYVRQLGPAVVRGHHNDPSVLRNVLLAGFLLKKLAPGFLALDVRVRHQEGVERLTGILFGLVEGLLYLLLLGIAEYAGLIVDGICALGGHARREDRRRYQEKQHREQEPREHSSSKWGPDQLIICAEHRKDSELTGARP